MQQAETAQELHVEEVEEEIEEDVEEDVEEQEDVEEEEDAEEEDEDPKKPKKAESVDDSAKPKKAKAKNKSYGRYITQMLRRISPLEHKMTKEARIYLDTCIKTLTKKYALKCSALAAPGCRTLLDRVCHSATRVLFDEDAEAFHKEGIAAVCRSEGRNEDTKLPPRGGKKPPAPEDNAEEEEAITRAMIDQREFPEPMQDSDHDAQEPEDEPEPELEDEPKSKRAKVQ